MKLKTLIGDYPVTRQFRTRTERFEFAQFQGSVASAFKRVVRDLEFDVAEMAIMTFLVAKAFGKPYRLLPFVVMARFQHPYLVYNSERGDLRPEDLHGKRIGVRSYSVTTGAWIRGILANDYGVDLGSVDWVTFEDAHVAEFRDTTKRAPAGKQIIQMLIDGELDAILGEKSDHPDLKPLFADVAAEEGGWFAKHKVVPINHMMVVSHALSDKHPEAVREVHRLLAASADASASSLRFNADEVRRSLELIIDYTAQQGLIPRAFAVDELFDDVTRALL